MLNYDNFYKTFSNSRKNLKWEEIEYFFDYINKLFQAQISILDIWAWNWRLYWEILSSKLRINNYIWIDISNKLLDEARKNYNWINFLSLDMLNIDNLDIKDINIVFFIASFHHINSIENRLSTLEKLYNWLEKNSFIFMTNWALNSQLNYEKYKNSIISWSNNIYNSLDYNIKIWANQRYYHCFSLLELDFLFKKSWFQIIENSLFKNNKNLISILRKI